MSPHPDTIKQARTEAGLTTEQAARLVWSTPRAWQRWEDGSRRMHPGLWELFRIKCGIIQPNN